MEASSGLAAAAQEPAAPAAPTAVAWLRDAWQQSSPPSEGEQAITLYDALRRGTLTARRGDAVAAYWKLCEHQLRLQTEQDLLARLMEVQPPEGSGAMLHWRAAYEQAQAEVRDAELKQLQAQLALQGFWPRGSGIRPRPGEMPFAGAYQTRIETLFPGDSAPASLRQLHQTLPLELAAVEAIARAVAAREQLAEAFAQSYSQGQSQLTGVLDTLARLRQQRVRLIEGIVGYNLHIAEYALAIGGTQGDATVASMLIPRPDIPATTSFERAELRPVAAFEPLQPVPGQAPAGQALIYREPATYPTPIPGASR